MINMIFTFSARSLAVVLLVIAASLALAACSGDPRPLQEAVEVQELGLTRLEIESDQASLVQTVINPQQTIQHKFKAFDRDNNDITANVENSERRWSVSNYDVADISGSGLLTAKADGLITVGLRIGGIVAEPLVVKVSSAVLTTLDGITGADSLTECSASEAYTATGTFSDGSTRLLGNLQWRIISNPNGVLLSSTLSEAVVGGLLPGSFALLASSEGISGFKDITVTQGVESLAITPSPVEVERNANLQLVARASYSVPEMQSQNVTALASWEVEGDDNIASISDEGNTKGEIRGLVLGQTTVTATCTPAAVTIADVEVVEPANIIGLRIEPIDDPVEIFVNGGDVQLRVFALSSLGSDEEVTNRASWQVRPGGEDIIFVDNTSSAGGLVTALAVGRATIEVSYAGIDQTIGVTVR